MARIPIFRKNGAPTTLFWSDSHDGDGPLKRVFRTTDDGRVQRSKSIRYDTRRKQLRRV